MPHQRFQSSNIKPRYAKGHISLFGINSAYPRPPWVAAWWSVVFPGFGHLFLGRTIYGFILVIWELVVNSQADLNMGIALSFHGKFEEAKSVISQEWVLLYVAVYLFAIWDSYRSAVELSKAHILSEIEDAPISPSDISYFDYTILDKKNPLVGMVWSILSPGLGQLYSGSTVVGAFVLAWWIFVTYKAQAIGAWLYSFLGDFNTVTVIVNWQWFLFLPSMYVFSMYHAYAAVNENNALYDIEQIRYLRVRAENLGQLNTTENNTVQIIASFDHSPFVEMAIHDMETMGIPAQNIIALPLENNDAKTHIIDSIHRVDGRSILDGAMVGASIFMVLGTIYGFVWKWGPVIWGLLGLIGGFILGLIVELLLNKKKLQVFASRKSEVIIQVTCDSSLQNQTINVLKTRRAIGYLILPHGGTM
ncbi:hypothetical protein [Ammoniphilus sp. CFH 90114]|uniref:hypothetical protein n=1 Tax=Ammoniphilus sp. CFH 90114 TaxID=2493665 RepID=UPI00100E2581|nr:hypothetical protein [Ammoniphilus sp. CFH 90114]RXT03712.1 hypothetical protein EIZ39_22950 [Ammoniphilus sp. CFH 90114]